MVGIGLILIFSKVSSLHNLFYRHLCHHIVSASVVFCVFIILLLCYSYWVIQVTMNLFFRIEKMLDWVRLCHLLNGSTGGSKKFVFFASHIHTIACILCSSFTMEEVKKNISLDLVNHCYQWSQVIFIY